MCPGQAHAVASAGPSARQHSPCRPAAHHALALLAAAHAVGQDHHFHRDHAAAPYAWVRGAAGAGDWVCSVAQRARARTPLHALQSGHPLRL